MTIDLIPDDVNELKRLPFATTIENTYIAIGSSLIVDLAFSNNPTQSILTDNATQALNLTQDDTGPLVLSASLNIAQDMLQITFDEPVLVSNLSVAHLSLSSTVNGNNGRRLLSLPVPHLHLMTMMVHSS